MKKLALIIVPLTAIIIVLVTIEDTKLTMVIKELRETIIALESEPVKEAEVIIYECEDDEEKERQLKWCWLENSELEIVNKKIFETNTYLYKFKEENIALKSNINAKDEYTNNVEANNDALREEVRILKRDCINF